MDEQEKSPKYTQNIKKYKLRKVFFCIAKFLGGIAVIMAIATGSITIYNNFFTMPDIGYKFAKYKVGNVLVYAGELINKSSYHAKELTVKGKFNSKIISLDVITSDTVEKKEINKPTGSIEFSLKRLSGKNNCKFDIILNQESEIERQVHLSWGEKGKLVLNPHESDENIKRGIELREKISELDLSLKARQKWLENNAKNIRK
jgi:hypothetical protein